MIQRGIPGPVNVSASVLAATTLTGSYIKDATDPQKLQYINKGGNGVMASVAAAGGDMPFYLFHPCQFFNNSLVVAVWMLRYWSLLTVNLIEV